jgi:predicted enzyme related to lactoylglutathione lyase
MSSQPTAKPLAPQAIVAMLQVADMPRSVEFYRQLGFVVANTYEPEGRLCWAWVQSGKAHLMLTLTESPQPHRPVMFYLYVQDVNTYRDGLIGKGIGVSEMTFPFWNQKGEFHVTDPDGFTVYVAETDDLEI